MIPLTAAITWFFLAIYSSAVPQLSGPYSAAHCATMKQIGESNNRGVKYACLPMRIPRRDPRCDGAARYEAMRDGDLSGHGTGHACQ